jgi:hypothetical protein
LIVTFNQNTEQTSKYKREMLWLQLYIVFKQFLGTLHPIWSPVQLQQVSSEPHTTAGLHWNDLFIYL